MNSPSIIGGDVYHNYTDVLDGEVLDIISMLAVSVDDMIFHREAELAGGSNLFTITEPPSGPAMTYYPQKDNFCDLCYLSIGDTQWSGHDEETHLVAIRHRAKVGVENS